ncbi:MAG: hypothetical protein M3R32_03905 [Chloroflexota bacterium]|nr:hypothetical protein [Chloroflexota bacterium]
MQRAAGWIGPRDGILGIGAVVIGLAIGYVDSRPTWDDTGITVALVLLTAGMVAGMSGRRPWLWALLVGAWVPLFEITGAAGAASLAALAVAAVGAFAGYAVVRKATPA